MKDNQDQKFSSRIAGKSLGNQLASPSVTQHMRAFPPPPFQLSAAPPVQKAKVQGESETGPETEGQEVSQLQKSGQVTGAASTPPPADKPNNTGMPDNLKSGIESLSSFAMDDVKVHYNSPEPAQLQAHAYAQGTDIHIGPGQEKHLPHEAWHVVQQKQGRVQATRQMKGGVGVNDDVGLEREADVMGGRAISSSESSNQRKEGGRLSEERKIVQRVFSDQHAKAFVKAKTSGINWPINKPNNWINWFNVKAVGGSTNWGSRWTNTAEEIETIKFYLEIEWDKVEKKRKEEREKNELDRAKEDALTSVPQTLMNHILKGDLNSSNDPTGYHSKAGNSPTHEAYGDKTQIDNNFGTYQQSVRLKPQGRKKLIQSTFFPDTVGSRPTSEDDIRLALGTAMVSFNKTVKFPIEWRGMKLDKVGATWFPTGGSDNLAPSPD